MTGNVHEWTPTAVSEPCNGVPRSKTRVYRGGAWSTNLAESGNLNSALRFHAGELFTSANIGFRCEK
jgi:formylglycine-generating enzyme required for sulfatase activity